MQESIFVRDLAVVLMVAALVGWGAQRIGLSSVVGFLLAGIAIGPFSPAIPLVSNVDNLQLLAHMGLVFLMFSIGLGLSFARLQRMGISILAAVAISSILLFNVSRWFGSAMGWSTLEILFLAGTLMVSSSAIIIKILDELNIMHQRAGQLAVGITVLEDIVAVVMLTLFISMVKAGSSPTADAPFWSVLGGLAAFVVFLLVVAMLGTPRLLKAFGEETGGELRVITVTGLVLFAADAALEAGYSLALGAFIMGVVVAGTRFKSELENAMGALHTIFGAVFFVAVGTMFDWRLLIEAWWLILLVSALTIVARPLACAAGLVAVGHERQDALKAGISLIPIGEFAFVMIQVGKSSNLLSDRFYALGIGVSLVTAIIAPFLTRRADAITGFIHRSEPRVFGRIIEMYHRWLEAMQARGNASFLWRLISKRVFHTGFHLLFVSALLIFSGPAYRFASERFGHAWFGVAFWLSFLVIILGPLIVLWRNLEALAMILAEAASAKSRFSKAVQPILQMVIKAVFTIVLLAWLLLLIPVSLWAFWALCIATIALALIAPRFWKRLINLQTRLEVDLRSKIDAASTLGSSSGLPDAVLKRPQEWNLQIDEIPIPSGSEHSGKRIAELAIRKRFGCSIMTIDRQGYLIMNPTADERLFAADKLLLLGTEAQLVQAGDFLRASAGAPRDELEGITMETIDLVSASASNQTIADLKPAARFNVQICGIERNGARILIPSFDERLHERDRILVLGKHADIQRLRNELELE